MWGCHLLIGGVIWGGGEVWGGGGTAHPLLFSRITDQRDVLLPHIERYVGTTPIQCLGTGADLECEKVCVCGGGGGEGVRLKKIKSLAANQ